MFLDSKQLYIDGYVNKDTGLLVNQYDPSYNYDAVGGTVITPVNAKWIPSMRLPVVHTKCLAVSMS